MNKTEITIQGVIKTTLPVYEHLATVPLKKTEYHLGVGILWHGLETEVNNNIRALTVTVNFKWQHPFFFHREMIFTVKTMNGVKK